jgi:hypothetical protein
MSTTQINEASTRITQFSAGDPNEPPDDLIETTLTIDSPAAGALLAGPAVTVNGTANLKIDGGWCRARYTHDSHTAARFERRY